MPHKLFKLLAGVFLAFSVLFAVSLSVNGWGDWPSSPRMSTGQELKVTALDIGQGDSILIQTPYRQTILIDGGPNNTVLSAIGRHVPFYQNTIDIMILTHPHADHVTGLVEVLRRYHVKAIYATGVIHTAGDYVAWLAEVESQQIPLTIVDQPFVLELGDELFLEFLTPLESHSGQTVKNLNNTSIVNRLVYRDVAFLLTGDMEKEQEEELLISGQDVRADVLKVGHHGSATSTSEDLLAAVQPRYAMISCGVDNRFGHPHAVTINKMNDWRIEYWRTDLIGDVIFVTDGYVIITP